MLGAHEVQQPERLGAECVAVPDRGQPLRIIERVVQHSYRPVSATSARHRRRPANMANASSSGRSAIRDASKERWPGVYQPGRP
jgi:hypothetical protein